jgi:succinate dehydrogenase/fumarate reductase flavoprotein subunit
MVFDLIGNGNVAGAIGISTRKDEVTVFRANSVILGTGALRRLFPGPTPGWMPNMSFPGTVTGDGRAMAYRAGAELVNMEILAWHAGPKYFARQGQGTWMGILRDPQGRPVGPFLNKPDRQYSDMIVEVNKGLFLDYAKSGRGPVYMDCRGISDDDNEYMMHWLEHEGNMALIKHLEEEGIDVRRNPVEFMTYEARPAGVIRSNARSETSVGGLYAIGDETLGGISAAATFGWVAGEHAAEHARRASLPSKVDVNIEEKKTWLEEMRGREAGPDWREAITALQQIMNDYAGAVRSETLLEAGFNHLQRLKKKVYTTLIARNQHELMHNLEALNLLGLAELVFVAAMERKETRRNHVRTDYPFANPLLDKSLIVKKVHDKLVFEWREAGR